MNGAVFELGGGFAVRVYGIALTLAALGGWYLLRARGANRHTFRAYALSFGGALLAGAFARAAGGVASFGGLAAAASIGLLCVPKAYRDDFALAFSVSASVVFVGAAFEGVIYGAPNESVFSLAYARGFAAHTDHLARHWIDPASSHSLRTEPLALYATLVAALSGFVAFVLRRFVPSQAVVFAGIGASFVALSSRRQDRFDGDGDLIAGVWMLTLACIAIWIARVGTDVGKERVTEESRTRL